MSFERVMRISSVSSERISIQQEFGSSCVPMDATPAHHLLHEGRLAADAAADEIAVAADIFGQRAQGDIGAAFQRRLKHRTEHGIVDHDRRSIAVASSPARRR